MERVKSIERSRMKGKKYQAFTSLGRTIHFGATGFEQYKDSTKLGLFSSKDHGDKQRRRAYFLRHSKVPGKREAIKKELRKSKGKLNAKILSHRFLW